MNTYLGRNPLKDQNNSFFNDSDFGFRLKNVQKFLKDIHEHPHQIFGKHVKKRFINFIQMCLTEDPKQRATAFQLQHHKWLESVKNAEKVSAVERLTCKNMNEYINWRKNKSINSSAFVFSGAGRSEQEESNIFQGFKTFNHNNLSLIHI